MHEPFIVGTFESLLLLRLAEHTNACGSLIVSTRELVSHYGFMTAGLMTRITAKVTSNLVSGTDIVHYLLQVRRLSYK